MRREKAVTLFWVNILSLILIMILSYISYEELSIIALQLWAAFDGVLIGICAIYITKN